MKVAVTSRGDTLDSPFEQRFGRSPGFLIYDTETKDYEYINNSVNLNLPQGAGIQAAQTISNSGAEAVITGHCGPKAFQVLKAAKIKIYYARADKVKDAIEEFLKGKLVEADGSDVEGHWA